VRDSLLVSTMRLHTGPELFTPTESCIHVSFVLVKETRCDAQFPAASSYDVELSVGDLETCTELVA